MTTMAVAVGVGAAVAIGSYLFGRGGNTTTHVEGRRLGSTSLRSSSEGSGVVRLTGTQRIDGNVIWATTFKETVTTTKETTETGGKGGSPTNTVETTNYTYSLSLAWAFVDNIDYTRAALGRVWADGKLLDLSNHTHRFYEGSDTQLPDPKIEAVQGIGKTPAYRGTVYLVIEDFEITPFGNRVPNITAEITVPVQDSDPEGFTNIVTSIRVGEGHGMHDYSRSAVAEISDTGVTSPVNTNNTSRVPNAELSLDELEAQFPNLDTVVIPIAWYCDDLDAGATGVFPRVLDPQASYSPAWKVAEYTPSLCAPVTKNNEGVPTTGGTPSDASITAMIAYAKNKGWRVLLSPRVIVDVELSRTKTILPLLNPGAEHGTMGWTTPLGTAGTTSEIAHTGTHCFRSPISPTNHSYQDMAVRADLLTHVDAGSVSVFLGWAQTGKPNFGGYSADVLVEFLDGMGASIGAPEGAGLLSVVTWPVWLERSHQRTLPTGTRTVRVWQYFEQAGATSLRAAAMDTISAHLAHPAVQAKTPYSDNSSVDLLKTQQLTKLITPAPAHGFAGSPSGTSGISAPLNHFMLSHRFMVEHYAALGEAAGGVDGFVIGDGLAGITRSKNDVGAYVGVNLLRDLAISVNSIVGPTTKLTYAADWRDEWGAHIVGNNTYYPLDYLWGYGGIDACGVNYYPPIGDWRNNTTHTDYNETLGPVNQLDPSYLTSQIEGGEHFDYMYPSQADRTAQNRVPIPLGSSQNQDFALQQKNIRDWWANSHHEIIGGVSEFPFRTDWTAKSKPIWLASAGCRSIDMAPNQPDAPDVPFFSSGSADSTVQQAVVPAILKYWADNSPVDSGGAPMLSTSDIFVDHWDIRPHPYFPANKDVWGDAHLWATSKAFSGKMNAALGIAVKSLCLQAGMLPADVDVSGLIGANAALTGHRIDGPETVRSSIQTLAQGYMFDGFESEGKLKFVLRGNTKLDTIVADDYVVSDSDPVGVTITHGQETEQPSEITIIYVDKGNDYGAGAVSGRTSRGYSQRVDEINLPLTLTTDYARALADSIVQQKWLERKSGTLSLPPSKIRLEVGDGVSTPIGGYDLTTRIVNVAISESNKVEFVAFDPVVFKPPPATVDNRATAPLAVYSGADLIFLDIPMFTGEEVYPWAPRLAAHADAWPGSISVHRQTADLTYKFSSSHVYNNSIGALASPLPPGPVGVWDRDTTIELTIGTATLFSQSELRTLESSLALGVYNALVNEWEIIQFSAVELTPTGYKISNLLRGQMGSEHAIADAGGAVPTGARVVVLEPAFLSVLLTPDTLVASEIAYKWGATSRPITDPTYQTGLFTGKRVGLRPYAPAGLSLRADRSTDNLRVAWKRRTRFGGDGWDGDTVPLNEEFALFRVRVYDTGVVVDEFTTADEYLIYTAAQQVAGLGGLVQELEFDVAQYGQHFGGYGMPAKTTKTIEGTI